jgi:poly [ADP-ribose] polymerase
MVRSPFFDGFQPNWFHLECFFFKKAWGAAGPEEMQGLAELRPPDQRAVADGFVALQAVAGAQPAAAGGGKSKGGKAAKAEAAILADRSGELPAPDGTALLRVEHAKSARAKCRYCEEKIEKGVLRLGVRPRLGAAGLAISIPMGLD